MSMGTWTPRELRRGKRSITKGKDKNDQCKTSKTIAGWKKSYWARASRSYKQAGYAQWCSAMDLVNR